jgi:hypothetical protein
MAVRRETLDAERAPLQAIANVRRPRGAHMSSKGWIHETTAFVLASALAGPAAAQNLLSNPDFDSGVPAELPSPEEEDVWHPLSGDFEAPPEAQSAQVRLKSTWTSGTRRARFDVIFLPEPSPGLAAGVGGLALWVMARRRRTR